MASSSFHRISSLKGEMGYVALNCLENREYSELNGFKDVNFVLRLAD